MSTDYARVEGGQRIKLPRPFNRGKKFSFIGAITNSEVLAALYGQWNTTTEIFTHFIEHHLAPKLNHTHLVIMDNLGIHQSNTVQQIINDTGADSLFLPPYSPELNPIENMWSKIKNLLRKMKARTVNAFHKAIQMAFKSIEPDNLKAWFRHVDNNLDHLF